MDKHALQVAKHDLVVVNGNDISSQRRCPHPDLVHVTVDPVGILQAAVQVDLAAAAGRRLQGDERLEPDAVHKQLERLAIRIEHTGQVGPRVGRKGHGTRERLVLNPAGGLETHVGHTGTQAQVEVNQPRQVLQTLDN